MSPANRMERLRERLQARAKEVGCADECATDAVIEALLEREVRVPAPTAEECRRWYDANPREFTAGELVFARHILFAVTPKTPVEPLRRKAEETLLELRTRPELFAERAAHLSNCPSGAQGGSLGQLARGDCVPEFEAAVFGEVGHGILPTLVRTRHGFHIVGIDRRVAGRRLPFEAVEAKIAAHLETAALRKALEQYAEALEAA